MSKIEPLEQTPTKKKASSKLSSAKPPPRDKAQTQMVHDLCGEYVGPMPVHEFLETFVPDNNQAEPVDMDDNMFFGEVPTKANQTMKSIWDQELQSTFYHSQTPKSVQERDLYEPLV